MAEPSPVVTLTLIPPIILQTEMYQIMFLDPCLMKAVLGRGRTDGCGERGCVNRAYLGPK